MTFKEYIIKREKEYTGSISNPDDLIEINDAEEYHKEYLEIVKDDLLHSVSEMFDFADYLYGNFDYHDNTKDGDIYIHNDNNLKYNREKIYQQWLGIRNSR